MRTARWLSATHKVDGYTANTRDTGCARMQCSWHSSEQNPVPHAVRSVPMTATPARTLRARTVAVPILVIVVGRACLYPKRVRTQCLGIA